MARLWSLTTGELRAELPGHRLAVMDGVAVGAWLATLDETGGLYLWDPSSGEPAGALPGEGAIAGLTARGDRLIDRGEGRTRVWRFTPAALLRRFPGHVARVRDLRFDERGARLWSASSDGTARGVELATGAATWCWAGHAPRADHPHGLRPAARRPAQPARDALAHPDPGRAQRPHRQRGRRDRRRWDAATGAAVATWRGHAGRVRRVAVSADGTTAFSIRDTTLRRWDVASGRELQRAELGEPPWDLSLFGDGAAVAVLADDGRQVTLWDAASLAPRGRGPGPNRLRELVMAGDRVVAASADHLVLLDAARSGRALAAHTSAFAADVDAAGATIAVGNARGEVVLHDAATAAALRRWPTGELMTTAVRFRRTTARSWPPPGPTARPPVGPDDRASAGRLAAHAGDDHPARLEPRRRVSSPSGRGGGTIWVWDVSGADGPDADALVACVSPWRLDDSALVSATFDAAACRAHLR
ncbi:MAG: hypothetical protein HS111_32865 [Kofleriaceae bacterium]|nr:hypothetical protein [Kofleriaceae bacterium]